MFSFAHVDTDFDILFEKLTAQIGGWICKTPYAHYAFGVGNFLQSLSSFLMSLKSGDMHFDALILNV